MKRLGKVSEGVYEWSNGMIGTADLPQFISETAYYKHSLSKKQSFLLSKIKPPVVRGLAFSEQLNAARKLLKVNRRMVAS